MGMWIGMKIDRFGKLLSWSIWDHTCVRWNVTVFQIVGSWLVLNVGGKAIRVDKHYTVQLAHCII